MFYSAFQQVSGLCLTVLPQLIYLLFLFTLTALKALVNSTVGSCFQRKGSKNPLYTTYSAQNYKVNLTEHLAATESDICLNSWWRPKQSKKKM